MSKDISHHIGDLHFEHVQWKKECLFWKDEIESFTLRLGEVVSRWTDNEIRAKIEHFQNQFILHDEVIDILKKDIKLKEKELASYAEMHPVAVDKVKFEDHVELRDRMDTQRSIYGNLKSEYFSFLSKNM